MKPQLYRRYTREEAAALFGSIDQAHYISGDQWVVFPNAVLCFTDIGSLESRSSCFETASSFWWASTDATDFDGRGDPLIPEPVRGNYKPRTEVWLFARWGDAVDYMCLGNLSQSYKSTRSRTGQARVEFPLTPALPWRYLSDITGVTTIVGDFGPVEAALSRLDGSTTAAERFQVLQTLVEYWRGPIVEGDGYREEELVGIDMPDVLRWWYRWAGKREEVMSNQNFLRNPGALELTEEGDLLFYIENQGCNLWAVPLIGEDPLVRMQENSPGAPWQTEQVRLTEHLIIACLFEAVIACPYGAMAMIPKAVLEEIVKTVQPLPLSPWLWFSTCVYCSNGVAMSAMSLDRDCCTVWIGSLTEQPVQFLKPFVNEEDWMYVSI